MGEQVASLRALVKRSTLCFAAMKIPTADTNTLLSAGLPSNPYDYGSNTVGVSTPLTNGDYIVPITPLTYFGPMYSA